MAHTEHPDFSAIRLGDILTFHTKTTGRGAPDNAIIRTGTVTRITPRSVIVGGVEEMPGSTGTTAHLTRKTWTSRNVHRTGNATIHQAHQTTRRPACVAYSNTRSLPDAKVTFVTDNVTCLPCLLDIDERGQVTEEAARAQQSDHYDPYDYTSFPSTSAEVIVNTASNYTIITMAREPDPIVDADPVGPGFHLDRLQHLTGSRVVVVAEELAQMGHDVIVYYGHVTYPRHLRGHRPIGYVAPIQSDPGYTWFRVHHS